MHLTALELHWLVKGPITLCWEIVTHQRWVHVFCCHFCLQSLISIGSGNLKNNSGAYSLYVAYLVSLFCLCYWSSIFIHELSVKSCLKHHFLSLILSLPLSFPLPLSPSPLSGWRQRHSSAVPTPSIYFFFFKSFFWGGLRSFCPREIGKSFVSFFKASYRWQLIRTVLIDCRVTSTKAALRVFSGVCVYVCVKWDATNFQPMLQDGRIFNQALD